MFTMFAETLGKLRLAECPKVSSGADAGHVQPGGGAGADTVKLLDRQCPQNLLGFIFQDHVERVGFAHSTGELGEELAVADAGGDRQAGLAAYVCADQLSDQGRSEERRVGKE